jgi:hypothetical protein
MSNELSLGGGETITSREGDVVMSTPLEFSLLLRHVGGSMEVEERRNGG